MSYVCVYACPHIASNLNAVRFARLLVCSEGSGNPAFCSGQENLRPGPRGPWATLTRWELSTNITLSIQWSFQDPKIEVLYHIRPYFGGGIPLHRPYIGLIYGRYLQFRFLKWPLINGVSQLHWLKLLTIIFPMKWPFWGHTAIPHFQIDPLIWIKSLWYSQCLGLTLWDVVKGWKWMKMASRNLWPILHGKYHHWLFGIGVKHAAAAACLTFEDLGQHFSILSQCQAGSHIRQAAQHSAFSQICPVLDLDIGHHTPS